MSVDLPPQPLCLLWREGYAPSSDEDRSGIDRVCGSIRLGALLLVAGDGPFLFEAIGGHDWGARVGWKAVAGIQRYLRGKSRGMVWYE